MTSLVRLTHPFHYLKFFFPLFLVFLSLYSIVHGATPGWNLVWVIGGLLILEFLLGDTEYNHDYRRPAVFVGMMYGYILLTLALYLLFVWTLVFYTKGTDFLGLADVVYAMTHVDMTQTHQDVGLGSLIFYILMVGTVGGAGAIGLGHELSHRTKEPIATLAARVAGIPAAFTYYAIEHAQGHHCTVATSDDSSTALRGESLYRYFLRTMPRDYRMAWDIESDRMRRMGLPTLSSRNRLLQGWLAEAVVFLGVAWAAGQVGFLLFALAALWTHFAYKLATYGQHYGITRVPGSEVKSHHAWDSANRLDFWLLAGGSRHMHHHLDGSVEFWNLETIPNAPRLRFGYLLTILAGTIPPLWYKLSTPMLIQWDEQWATPEERVLADRANAESGIPELVARAATSSTQGYPNLA